MGEQRFALSPDSTWVASHPASPQTHLDLQARFLAMSEKGLRVLGLAVTPCEADRISKADERDMTFVGFLVLSDPPKREARDTIAQLRELGVALKVITGDNRAVAASISAQVGIESPEIVTGEEIRTLSEMALRQREKLFQTGWFIESTLTGLVILLVIRTQRQLIYSKPGRMFLIAELFVAVMTLAIPFSPMGDLLGFVRPPSQLLLITVVITFLYGLGMEIVKYGFYRFLAK